MTQSVEFLPPPPPRPQRSGVKIAIYTLLVVGGVLIAATVMMAVAMYAMLFFAFPHF